MTTDPTHLSEEYRAALSAFGVHAQDVRHGPESLYPGWYRMRVAGARCTTDPTAGVAFGDAVEAAIACRLANTPFVMPTARATR